MLSLSSGSNASRNHLGESWRWTAIQTVAQGMAGLVSRKSSSGSEVDLCWRLCNSAQEAPREPAGWGGNRNAWQCFSSALYGWGLTLHDLANEKGSSTRERKMELKSVRQHLSCPSPASAHAVCLVTREPVLSTLLGSLLFLWDGKLFYSF